MIRYVMSIIVLFSVLSCSANEPVGKKIQTIEINEIPATKLVTPRPAIVNYLDSLGFLDIEKTDKSILVDLKYATTDNFTGNILYHELDRAYLHPIAMERLSKASSILRENHPGLYLLVYDATRPLSVQKEMYNAVKDTKYKAYVANPSRTSLHNYGMAVDLTICDSRQNPLDMGTVFDYFGKIAGTNQEDLLTSQGLLTQQQVNNRRLLRSIMQQAGFIPIRGEWWHFNACPLGEAQRISNLVK